MDDALLGVVLDRLDRTSPTEATSSVLLAALEGDAHLAEVLGGATRARPAPRPSAAAGGEPAGAYLSAIAAAGFRGIGPAATLPVAPGPGLTVVAGRNGSGKSSFAEALEVLLTGGLRRWMSLPMVWKEGWRNLHDATAPFVRAELVIEGAGPLTVERTWDAKAGLERGKASVRTAGGPPGALDRLGWTIALSEFRPFLSHAELEAFFGRPSDRYDRSGDGVLPWLARVSSLTVAAGNQVRAAAARLRRAADGLEAVAGTESERSRELARLLIAAVAHHRGHGDGDCPVCGRASALDEEWHRCTEAEIDRLQGQAAGAEAARDAARQARAAAVQLIAPSPPELGSCADPDVVPTSAARAWEAWATLPPDADVGAGAPGLRVLADHLDATWPVLDAALAGLRDRAGRSLASRQDRWSPVAAEVAAWCQHAEGARQGVTVVATIKAAEAWLKDATDEIRNARLAPIANGPRDIWAQLRQESNVDLDAIRLSGSRTRRDVDIDVRVDGAPAQALGVMSQGEINALALSVFLPRATLPASPFRFLVIDDPVQAMDPAKVDGLARVLAGVAEDRQVIVFTHDDRLPEAIRRLAIAATILEVTRRPGSQVAVRLCLDPVRRALSDAAALCADDKLPPEVARRVVPGLCRIAVETWLVQDYRKRRLEAGDDRMRIDQQLDAADRLMQKAALAFFDDAGRAGEVLARINAWGRWAGDLFQQLNRGAHGVVTETPDRVLADTRSLLNKPRQATP